MTQVKYIVGVDAALRNVGVVVIDNTGEVLLKKNITTKTGTHDHTSVDEIVEQFFEILEPFMTIEVMAKRAIHFFFEDTVFTQKGKGIARAEAVGVLKWMLRQEKLNVFGVHPTSLWSFICTWKNPGRLSSKEKKKWTIDWAHKIFNFWTENDNIADGFALARWGYALLVEGKKMTYRALCQIHL